VSDIVSHYQQLFRKFGDDPRATQQRDGVSQRRRFEILTEILPKDESVEVLDAGCGLAHLHDFLRLSGREDRYVGVDIVPEFVEAARSRLAGDPDVEVLQLDVLREDPPSCDYAFVSGAFNNRMSDNRGFMEEMLRRLWAVARRGIAFNAISTYVEYRDADLYYCDPREVFHFCRTELGLRVALRHDYGLGPQNYPYEFAISVLK
jgi:SAM-dependent methyltransferase